MNPMMKRLFLKSKAEIQTPRPVNKKQKLNLERLADGDMETTDAGAPWEKVKTMASMMDKMHSLCLLDQQNLGSRP